MLSRYYKGQYHPVTSQHGPPCPHRSLSLWRSLSMTGLITSSALMPPNTVTPPSPLSTQLAVKAPVKEF